MRLATKNEILILLGACVPLFAAHCISAAGATTKFLFDNASSFDLDSALVQGMIAQLNTAGIVDVECLGRFAAFGATVSPPEPTPIAVTYAFRVPDGYPDPVGLIRSITDVDVAGRVVIVTAPIADGIAVEVTL